MKTVPYLNFNGNCAEAFHFYADVLGAEITMMQTHGDTPAAEHTPPEWHSAVMHARLERGDLVLMASDAPPDNYSRPQGLYVSLQVDEPEEADRIFAAFSDGGTVIMPIEQTFWAKRFGMAVDRYGTPWMVNCD